MPTKKARAHVGWGQLPSEILRAGLAALSPQEQEVCGCVASAWTAVFRAATWPRRLRVIGSNRFPQPRLTRVGDLAILRVPNFHREKNHKTNQLLLTGPDLGLNRDPVFVFASRQRALDMIEALTKWLVFVTDLRLENLTERLDPFLNLPNLATLHASRCRRFDESCISLGVRRHLDQIHVEHCFLSMAGVTALLEWTGKLSLGRCMKGPFGAALDSTGLTRLSLSAHHLNANTNARASWFASLSVTWESGWFADTPMLDLSKCDLSGVRELSLRARDHHYPDLSGLKSLVSLRLVGGSIELCHFPNSLERLALHSVAVTSRNGDAFVAPEDRCLKVKRMILKQCSFDAPTFDRVFQRAQDLSLAEPNSLKVQYMLAEGQSQDDWGEPRVLTRVRLMRPLPRITPSLVTALSTVPHVVLVEPTELEPGERSRLLEGLAVGSLELVGLKKREHLTWLALDERKVLRAQAQAQQV
jgi:hypothetical protein